MNIILFTLRLTSLVASLSQAVGVPLQIAGDATLARLVYHSGVSQLHGKFRTCGSKVTISLTNHDETNAKQ